MKVVIYNVNTKENEFFFKVLSREQIGDFYIDLWNKSNEVVLLEKMEAMSLNSKLTREQILHILFDNRRIMHVSW